MITKSRNLKGEGGGLYVTDTSAHAGDFDVILAHEASVISTATSSTISGTLTTVALPAGFAWYGKFSTFTLASGKVTAYYSS